MKKHFRLRYASALWILCVIGCAEPSPNETADGSAGFAVPVGEGGEGGPRGAPDAGEPNPAAPGAGHRRDAGAPFSTPVDGSIASDLDGSVASDTDAPGDAGSVLDAPEDAGSDPVPCVGLECQRPACAQGTTSVSGRVFAPNGETPLYNVIVYVPNAPLTPLNEGIQCDRCGAAITGLSIALTGADGSFRLDDVPAGTQIPIVMQVGKWRRQVHVDVTACEDNPLPTSSSRLPRNQSEGDMPQIALATGGADSLECLLRKLGVDDTEFTRPDQAGRVHLYQGYGNPWAFGFADGATLPGGTLRADALWSDFDTLRHYDMLVLGCEGAENLQDKPEEAMRAMGDYLNAGGRVFASDFHHVWFKGGTGDYPKSRTGVR